MLRESVSSVHTDVNMEGLTNADVQPHGLHDIDGNVITFPILHQSLIWFNLLMLNAWF